MKDTVMDLVITSGLKKSCLSKSITSSDFVIRDAENKKFRADATLLVLSNKVLPGD